MSKQIKIHNVFHDKCEFDSHKIENRIINSDTAIDTARIATGNTNSPIFITISDSINSISFETAQKLARRAVEEFSRTVPGVDVDKTITNKNIHIKNT
jgi:hypothetical protein